MGILNISVPWTNFETTLFTVYRYSNTGKYGITFSTGFHNPCSVWISSKLFHKQVIISWQHVGLWYEICTNKTLKSCWWRVYIKHKQKYSKHCQTSSMQASVLEFYCTFLWNALLYVKSRSHQVRIQETYKAQSFIKIIQLRLHVLN